MVGFTHASDKTKESPDLGQVMDIEGPSSKIKAPLVALHDPHDQNPSNINLTAENRCYCHISDTKAFKWKSGMFDAMKSQLITTYTKALHNPGL